MTRYDFRFERHFEEVGEAAFILDSAAGRIVAANPAGYAMLGYTLEELQFLPTEMLWAFGGSDRVYVLALVRDRGQPQARGRGD